MKIMSTHSKEAWRCFFGAFLVHFPTRFSTFRVYFLAMQPTKYAGNASALGAVCKFPS